MSFLVKLQAQGQEARAALRPTTTTVTTVTGTRLTTVANNTNNNSGNAPTTITTTNFPGFVVDTDPDPGLYECIPGLYIGSQDAAYNYHGTTVPHSKRRIRSRQQASDVEETDQIGTTKGDYYPGMAELGVTHVLNLFSQDQPHVHKGIIYRNLLLLDIPEQSIVGAVCLDDALSFISEALQPNPSSSNNNKVLVHCNAGVSRSATMIIAYLMKYHKMTYNQALETVRKNRPSAQPNRGFERQLKEWESTLCCVTTEK